MKKICFDHFDANEIQLDVASSTLCNDISAFADDCLLVNERMVDALGRYLTGCEVDSYQRLKKD